jgi:hypothetical protein
MLRAGEFSLQCPPRFQPIQLGFRSTAQRTGEILHGICHQIAWVSTVTQWLQGNMFAGTCWYSCPRGTFMCKAWQPPRSLLLGAFSLLFVLVWVHFCHMQSCKAWFCIRTNLSAIQIHLGYSFESTQNRRSRSHWKQDWQHVWAANVPAYASRCHQEISGKCESPLETSRRLGPEILHGISKARAARTRWAMGCVLECGIQQSKPWQTCGRASSLGSLYE